MFPHLAFVTTMNAQELANIIQHLYENPGQRYFKLEYGSVDSRQSKEAWIRPNPAEQPIVLANGDQIIICEQQDSGNRVDLIIPRRSREYTPATVVLSNEAHPGTDQ